MLNSARYSRRSRCVMDAHAPSMAIVTAATLGPNRSTDAKTNTSDIETVAEWPGTLIVMRPLDTVRTASSSIDSVGADVGNERIASVTTIAPIAATAATNGPRTQIRGGLGELVIATARNWCAMVPSWMAIREPRWTT